MTNRVSLITGEDRYQNVMAALDAIADDMDLVEADPILVKPNLVNVRSPLAVTHVDAVRALLDWLRARTELPIVVGEGTAYSSTWQAFREYGYLSLPDEYRDVMLADLNADDTVELTAFDWRLRPLRLDASRTAVQSRCRISIGPPKTHDTVLVTLSLKNMVMGSLVSRVCRTDQRLHDSRGTLVSHVLHGAKGLFEATPAFLRNSQWVVQAKELAVARLTASSKAAMHQGFPAMHLNLFALAPRLYPHLAVIDGFQAMEGNGPLEGEPVDWRLALASTDWLAADVTAARLMGFSLEEVRYLHYCAQADYGGFDPADIQVVGNAQSAQVARRFKRHDLAYLQDRWRSPAVSRHLRGVLAPGG